MRYFPVNFDIAGRQVLVVGGGQVAVRKIKSLLRCRARITVVAPSPTAVVRQLENIRIVERAYRKTDLRGACMVVSATDSEDVNRRVAEHATAAGIPVNVVDHPELCTFTVPAVLERGDLVVTVSTGGGSPALAQQVRDELDRVLPAGVSRHLQLLKEIRPQVRHSGLAAENRRKLIQHMASPEIRGVLTRAGVPAARAMIKSMLVAAVGKQRGM